MKGTAARPDDLRERERLEELVGRLEADDAQAGDLAPGLVEEHDPRRAEEPEPLEQRLVLGGVLRDVDLQQHHLRELGLDLRIAEGKPFHLLARHAPVGVEVDHDGPARSLQPRLELP